MKLRLRSTKLGRIRFVSHRDAARLWERALRKLGLPVAFTAGFTPRPKIGFGLALPTGAESIAEYLDVELVGEAPVVAGDPALHDALSAALPPGMDVVASAPSVGASLQEVVRMTTWELTFPTIHRGEADAACARLLAAHQLPLERVRKGLTHVDDVRPAISDLRVVSPTPVGRVDLDGEPDWCLAADLVTVGRALRPSELVTAAFGQNVPDGMFGALRTHQWITLDGERREVIALPNLEGRSDPARRDDATSAAPSVAAVVSATVSAGSDR